MTDVAGELTRRQAFWEQFGTPAMEQAIARRAQRYLTTLRAGGTLIFCGNGGSAATAQHIAAEYVGRFQRERGAYRAIALTTDTSILTAVGNDYGFDTIFTRQLFALFRPHDLIVLHSTSGNSANLLHAAHHFWYTGRIAYLLGGDGGALAASRPAQDVLLVPSTDTALIQEAQLAIEHIICGLVEEALP